MVLLQQRLKLIILHQQLRYNWHLVLIVKKLQVVLDTLVLYYRVRFENYSNLHNLDLPNYPQIHHSLVQLVKTRMHLVYFPQ